MQIEHVAIWTGNLERLKKFYVSYFQAEAGPKYTNQTRGFESYFLTFSSGARLELMSLPLLVGRPDHRGAPWAGYAHLAFSVGSSEEVDALAGQLEAGGHRVLDGPRVTGDGYYEAIALDPDGNRIEITIDYFGKRTGCLAPVGSAK